MNLISVHSIALTLSNTIAKELDLDNMKRAKISYGLEALIGAIIKSVTFLVVFLGFGVLKQSLIALSSYAILRNTSGGTHCKTFSGCLILSAAIFVSIGKLSKVLAINDYLFYTLNFVSLLIIVLRSPIDPPEKPIKTKQKRCIMKTLSIIVLLLLIYASSKTTENNIKNSIILAVYFQVLTLTNWDKKIYKYIDQFKLKTKEVKLE